jgi:undecaprenyl-diphosphatase
MFAATCKSLLDYVQDGGVAFSAEEITLLAVGNVVAFLVAMIAIKSFISYLTKNGFRAFGYYRIIMGVVILALWKLGYFEGVNVGDF